MPEPAVIALEDGALFRGEALAGGGSVGGELMFTTATTGYQQVVTDPACHGRLVAFTVPMVGNYGVHPEADESDRVHALAVICREITNYGFDRAAAGTWLEWLSARFPGAPLPVIYGGSVDAKVAPSIFGQPGVDGLFVGRSALDPVEFARIAHC